MSYVTYGERGPLTLAQKLWKINWPLIAVVALIGSVGVLMLYSVAGGSFQPWAEKHALRLVAGLGLLLLIAVVPLRVWLGLAYPAYLVALGLLVAVLVLGTESLGAKRWLVAGPLTFQPSELMKVALVLALARYYQWLPAAKVSRPLWVLIPLLAIAAPVALVVKQPDLGTSVLFAGVGLGILFLAGVSFYYFLAGGLSVALVAPFIWANLHGYQKNAHLDFP